MTDDIDHDELHEALEAVLAEIPGRNEHFRAGYVDGVIAYHRHLING